MSNSSALLAAAKLDMDYVYAGTASAASALMSSKASEFEKRETKAQSKKSQ